ncbi:hypothetical protein KR018_005375, partial [Drosophila ironensis]
SLAIFGLSQAFVRLLVNDGTYIPYGYISAEGNDIGPKADQNEWKEYLVSQVGFHIFCLFLILLLFLILSIVGAVYLRKSLQSLRKDEKCHKISTNKPKNKKGDMVDSTSRHIQNLYLDNYEKQFKRIKNDLENNPDVARPFREIESLADSIESLGSQIRKLPKIEPILNNFLNEIPTARFLASQLRDGLRGVKRDLMVYLNHECNQKLCHEFYRKNEIRILDMGCLHYEELPDPKDFLKAIDDVTKSNFDSISQSSAMQLRKIADATRNHMDTNLNQVRGNLEKGAKDLKVKYDSSIGDLREVAAEVDRDSKADRGSGDLVTTIVGPMATLRRKMSVSWYTTTLGFIIFLMLVPVVLLLAILICGASPRVSSSLLCFAIVAIFAMFWITLILLFFFLMHGTLLYHQLCSNETISMQTIKSSDYGKISDYSESGFMRSSSEATIVLGRCVNNDSLYKVLRLGDHFDLNGLRNNLISDISQDLSKNREAPLPKELKPISPNATKEADLLLKGNLSLYNSSLFTQHICRQLLPEPKPGPLPDVIRNLEELAGRVKAGPTLENQAIHLRALYNNLAQPLEKIMKKLMQMLTEIDNLLSAGYGNFNEYITSVVEKIKEGDEFLKMDSKRRGDNIMRVVKTGLDDYVGSVDSITRNVKGTCNTNRRIESSESLNKNDKLCELIAKPMNAIWFGLFWFAILLLLSLCCIHPLRSGLRGFDLRSCTSLVSMGNENFVTASLMPTPYTPYCQCYRYLPASPETNVDEDFYYYEDPSKCKCE